MRAHNRGCNHRSPFTHWLANIYKVSSHASVYIEYGERTIDKRKKRGEKKQCVVIMEHEECGRDKLVD